MQSNLHMEHDLHILSIAQRQPVMQEQLNLLHEKEQLIPGSVQYMIKRFRKQPLSNIDDTGMMVYNFKKRSREKIIWNCGFAFLATRIAVKITQRAISANLTTLINVFKRWKVSMLLVLNSVRHIYPNL